MQNAQITWKQNGRRHTADEGGFRAVVVKRGGGATLSLFEHCLFGETEKAGQTEKHASIDAAKAAAEKFLREALVQLAAANAEIEALEVMEVG